MVFLLTNLFTYVISGNSIKQQSYYLSDRIQYRYILVQAWQSSTFCVATEVGTPAHMDRC